MKTNKNYLIIKIRTVADKRLLNKFDCNQCQIQQHERENLLLILKLN